MLGTRYYTPLLSAQAVYKLWEATTNTTTTATSKENKYFISHIYFLYFCCSVYVIQDTENNHLFYFSETLLPCAH